MSLRNVLKDVPVTLNEKFICICFTFTNTQYTCLLALLHISYIVLIWNNRVCIY